jgi:hypothetical protein
LYYLSNNITCGFGTLQVTETLQAEGGKKKKVVDASVESSLSIFLV